jgi:hypothetical protein
MLPASHIRYPSHMENIKIEIFMRIALEVYLSRNGTRVDANETRV